MPKKKTEIDYKKLESEIKQYFTISSSTTNTDINSAFGSLNDYVIKVDGNNSRYREKETKIRKTKCRNCGNIFEVNIDKDDDYKFKGFCSKKCLIETQYAESALSPDFFRENEEKQNDSSDNI